MLSHLNEKCFTLTIRKKEEKFTETNILWDLDDELATYFVKLDHFEEKFKRDYNIKWPITMKTNRAVNEISNNEQFEARDMMEWEDKDDQDKTWVCCQSYLKMVDA